MKILFINEVCGITSTGRITCELADKLTAEGHECRIAYGRKGQVPERWQHYGVRIGGDWDVRLHALQTRLFDLCGFGSAAPTRRFLAWADTFDPDLIWIHNLHGYYIQVELLFAWLKSRPQTPVRWTLHDCWAFTGHCTHFAAVGCEQWKTGCRHCRQLDQYPKCSGISHVDRNYARKKAAFTGVPRLTIQTPSQWLADLVKQSFLQEYPVTVEYNTVDPAVFRPTPGDFRARYGLQDKVIVLGVANVWSERKGLADFVRLAAALGEKYQVVLVGVSEQQRKKLPARILALPKTANARELAQIYTAADFFFNPTYEDTYPTVNLEAEACGTPVITYATGGAPETIHRPDSVLVAPGDLNRVAACLQGRDTV